MDTRRSSLVESGEGPASAELFEAGSQIRWFRAVEAVSSVLNLISAFMQVRPSSAFVICLVIVDISTAGRRIHRLGAV